MTRQNRKTRSFGRVGTVALVVFLAASLLLALRPGVAAAASARRWSS